jgi:hypothetical protein
VAEEGTPSSFRGLVETIEQHGLFPQPPQPRWELDTDRGSHHSFTPQAGGKVSKTRLTQVGRALEQLGIGHIAAYSPPARGRCERAFRTLQDRLPKEPTLAGITTALAANRFLREVHLGEHNARFAVPAQEPASAFVEVPEVLWRDLLCVQEHRRVGPNRSSGDNCVHWQGRQLQIPPTPHLVRAEVRIHDHPDGTVAIFKGPLRLANFPPAAPASLARSRSSARARVGPAWR